MVEPFSRARFQLDRAGRFSLRNTCLDGKQRSDVGCAGPSPRIRCGAPRQTSGLAPRVAAGQVDCARCHERIEIEPDLAADLFLLTSRGAGRAGSRRPALRIFLVSRVAVWTLAAATVLLFDAVAPEGMDTSRLHDIGAAVDVWARWDSDWYLRIAEGWYDWPSGAPAFFPLYPTLVGGVGRLLDGHYVLAGVAVSTAACGVAFTLLHRLVRERLDAQMATRSVLFLAVFPTSLFLTAVYSESLFLALAIATFVLAERDRLGWAGVVAGLALLTRS